MKKLWIWLGVVVLAVTLPAGGDGAAAKRKKRPRKARGLEKKLSPLELAVWWELEALRKSPKAWGKRLAEYRGRFDGKHFEVAEGELLVTHDGVEALDEAVSELGKARKLPRLKLKKGMIMAARDHAKDLGEHGAVGHEGSDGTTAGGRLENYGKWRKKNSELLSFQWSKPGDIVAWWLINDGVADRGYRRSLLAKEFRVAGIGCAPHKAHETVCVVVLADRYRDSRRKQRGRQLRVYVTQ